MTFEYFTFQPEADPVIGNIYIVYLKKDFKYTILNTTLNTMFSKQFPGKDQDRKGNSIIHVFFNNFYNSAN